MAESHHIAQQSCTAPPGGDDGTCLPQDSSLSSFKDYHRITAARDSSQTRHQTIIPPQTHTEKLPLERDQNYSKRSTPTWDFAPGSNDLKSRVQQHPTLEEKDLACHESTQFTSPEDIADTPYLMKESARYLQVIVAEFIHFSFLLYSY